MSLQTWYWSPDSIMHWRFERSYRSCCRWSKVCARTQYRLCNCWLPVGEYSPSSGTTGRISVETGGDQVGGSGSSGSHHSHSLQGPLVTALLLVMSIRPATHLRSGTRHLFAGYLLCKSVKLTAFSVVLTTKVASSDQFEDLQVEVANHTRTCMQANRSRIR